MTDIEDRVSSLADKLAKTRDYINSEEATKTALIMPFISDVLGYDTTNPAGHEYTPWPGRLLPRK